MKSGISFFVFFLFSAFSLPAQQWLPDFKHFTTRDGLPTSEVYQITTDSQNNLWFASDRGAVKYDGYSFRTYDTRDGLPDNSIIKLYKDDTGLIWFISYTCLLSYYQDGKIVPYKYNNLIAANIKNEIVTALYADKNGNVRLNTLQGEMYTISASGVFNHLNIHVPGILFVINTNRSSSAEVNYLNGLDSSITTIRVETPLDTFSFTINEPVLYNHYSSLKLHNDDIIFYCERFLIHINKFGVYTVKKFKTPVIDVFEDGDHDLWVGTNQDGVYLCDSALRIKSHYLAEISVSHIIRDFEGGYWMSTLENGIFYLPIKNNSCFAIDYKPYNTRITDVFSIEDSILFFTSSKGQLYKFDNEKQTLNTLDLKTGVSTEFENLNSVNYNSATNSIILSAVKTFSGDSTFLYTRKWMDHKIFVLASLTRNCWISNDEILGGDYSHAFSFNSSNSTFRYLNNDDKRTTALYRDSEKRLFAGTLNGLFVIRENKIIPFEPGLDLMRSRITDIKELLNTYLVIGTRNNGIILYRDGMIKNITKNDELTSDNINCIAIDDSIIWAGTNKGVNKITIRNLSPFVFSVDQITINNGLVADEVNALAIGKRFVYVATNEGLSFVDKYPYKPSVKKLPLYISSVRINERDTAVEITYNLKPSQNNIGISYTGLSFRNSKNIKYKYRLMGLDTTWHTTSNRDVQFSGLESGPYTFQLISSGENGNYNEPVQIEFCINPHFYETIWFRISVAGLFLILIAGFFQARANNIRKKAAIQNELNKKISELNLNALRSQMNPHFTFNVLNSINYYIVNKDPESAQNYISKFARLIRMILDQSRTEFILLSEEIKMLTLYMELEELRFENKFRHFIQIDEKLNTNAIWIPGMLIQPFVENSIKHGIRTKKGDAQVSLNFSAEGKILICTITDNGVGRDEAAKSKESDAEYKSIGTTIVNERMEALSILFNDKVKYYTYDLKNENGAPTGTCVTIEIPYRNSKL